MTADAGRVEVDGISGDLPSVAGQPVPESLSQDVATLLSIAADMTGVSPDVAPYDRIAMPVPDRVGPATGQPASSDSDTASDEADARRVASSEGVQRRVMVRVLGPIDISGMARPFTRAWSLELVVYLAMHRGGVSNEAWSTALWPDRVMAPASLHSTASAARRSLGTSDTGGDHLPHARGRLALGDGVQTDWDRFASLAGSDDPTDWKGALALIRGRPFDGLRSPDWVILEGIAATIEAVVVDLACRYAQHCLEAHDAPGAEWASRQALRVSRYDERLYRALLMAADVAGNPAGVENVMAELVHLVADEVEPFDAIHPETAALYRSLSRRPLASKGR